MNKIINYGSLNIDMVYAVDHFARAGETVMAKGLSIFPGGKGLNQSIALSRAGADVYHIGNVAEDGLWLVELLKAHGVHTEYVRTQGTTTGTAVIQVSSEGNNSIIVNRGANGEMEKAYIQQTLSMFGVGDVLLLQNEMNDIQFAIDTAVSQGITVVLNPSPIEEQLRKLNFNQINYLILNEIEGKELTGETAPEQICLALLERNQNLKIVLTLGEQGALYYDREKHIYEGARTTAVVDTTAAGDTFTGYFLAEIFCRSDEKLALIRATVAASIAISRPGAAVSIPTLEEVVQ